MSDAISHKDFGLHVAGVMTSFRTQAGLAQNRLGRWMVANDTHDEYFFAMEHKELVTIIPVGEA